ncbi:Beta-barrel assembly-enhancing protease [Ascidiaceihabitans donghaensis]|uniref:Beta-barrel assembly-enhancing protease n=1 Tax=Ascidiaceihabitans donghaensis TaxID=1510460 RepID=A0A2R8BGJ8_9RHOB|nr:GSCFA domain-containing protein [Ascidiaceihabitans donghaensis]SPH22128.1 Beta-barrel assembly-enhancing protease [Ascidiaceihabitans donghaensis]
MAQDNKNAPPPFLAELSAQDAFAHLKTNTHARWPDRHDSENRVEPFCTPHFNAPFTLQTGASVFTLGSCFARNVEKSLIHLGFDLPARRAIGPGIQNNVLNTFTAASMLNEVTWALNPDAPFDPDRHLYDVGSDKVVDLHVGRRWALPTDKATAVARRTQIKQAYSALANCKLLVLTMGLVEAWYDAELGIYLNSPPLKRMIQTDPDRFRLRVMRHSDVVASMAQLIDTANAHNRVGGLNCILTVSPVPLVSTFRPDTDVIVANAYSKATLRSAAEEIAYRYENVSYFPSFESITLSDRHESWEDDQVHVRQGLVDLNVARMVAKYVETTDDRTEDPDVLTQLAANEVTAKRFDAALELADRALSTSPELERAVLVKARALAGQGELTQAFDFLTHKFTNKSGDLSFETTSVDMQVFAARLMLRLKRFDAVQAIASQILDQSPKHMPALIVLGDAHMGQRNFAAAERVFMQCLDMSKRQAQPYFKMAQLERARGQTDAALRFVDMALKMNPTHAGFEAFKTRLTSS